MPAAGAGHRLIGAGGYFRPWPPPSSGILGGRLVQSPSAARRRRDMLGPGPSSGRDRSALPCAIGGELRADVGVQAAAFSSLCHKRFADSSWRRAA